MAKKGKICIHIVPKYIKCGSNHQATAFKYPVRQKAQAVTYKNKAKKTYDREERETLVENLKDKEICIESEDREILGKSHKDKESLMKR